MGGLSGFCSLGKGETLTQTAFNITVNTSILFCTGALCLSCACVRVCITFIFPQNNQSSSRYAAGAHTKTAPPFQARCVHVACHIACCQYHGTSLCRHRNFLYSSSSFVVVVFVVVMQRVCKIAFTRHHHLSSSSSSALCRASSAKEPAAASDIPPQSLSSSLYFLSFFPTFISRCRRRCPGECRGECRF